MTVAQGINKTTSIKVQAGLGVYATGSGGQVLRRVTFVPQYDRDTFENNEIVPDQQSRGVSYGMKKTSAKLAGLLSPGTYSMLMQAILRADFAAGVTGTSTAHTIAGTGPTYTITRSTGWTAEGFKIGDVIITTTAGFNTANKNVNLIIVGLTATVATVTPLNGSTLVAEGPIAASVFSVVGKKTLAPTSGQTNRYFGIEDWYSDISKSEMFNDTKVNKITMKFPGTGNCTLDAEFVGLSRATGTSQVLTTPTAASTTGVCTAVNGDIYINNQNLATASITSFEVTVDAQASLAEAIIGSNSAIDINRGIIKVTGTFTGLFDSTTIRDFYNNETAVHLTVCAAVDTTGTSDLICINLPRIKITGDAPDDGQKMVARTYPFTAEYNASGGTGTVYDQTIMAIQDSAAA